MAELADAADSKSAGLRPLGVRLPLPAPELETALDARPALLHLKREPLQSSVPLYLQHHGIARLDLLQSRSE